MVIHHWGKLRLHDCFELKYKETLHIQTCNRVQILPLKLELYTMGTHLNLFYSCFQIWQFISWDLFNCKMLGSVALLFLSLQHVSIDCASK